MASGKISFFGFYYLVILYFYEVKIRIASSRNCGDEIGIIIFNKTFISFFISRLERSGAEASKSMRVSKHVLKCSSLLSKASRMTGSFAA